PDPSALMRERPRQERRDRDSCLYLRTPRVDCRDQRRQLLCWKNILPDSRACLSLHCPPHRLSRPLHPASTYRIFSLSQNPCHHPDSDLPPCNGLSRPAISRLP